MTNATTKSAAPPRHLNELSATEIVRGIAAGAFTCEAVTRACLTHIADQEPVIRAWTNFDPALALAQAQALDRATTRGPLHGLPIGVKDVLDTFDMPTEMGSPIYRGHRPPADAACVAAVRAAGAVILGKTVTCEFAGVTTGATTNPHDETRTPGGSSSGSGAAVADCMAPVAFGTQTGGSVLRPASYCGVIGYKPTYNAFNRFGVKPAAEGLDTIGLIARSLDDVALVRSVLLGAAPAPIAAVTAPPRIGLTRTHMWANAQPETVEAVEDAARRLNDAGATIVDVTLPEGFAELSHAREIINDYERAMGMAHEWHHHRDRISERLRKIIARGFELPHRDYVAAMRLAERCRAELDPVFGTTDVLLAPCVRGEAPEGHHYSGDPGFQALWTLLHTPTLTLPTAIGPNGLPVGIQLVGRRHDDERLLAVSAWIFAMLGIRRPWRGHRS
jgi:Asp-tRNA(Asn)/Glu-tRNA(Gln) amidotransferase A subunit family amidase